MFSRLVHLFFRYPLFGGIGFLVIAALGAALSLAGWNEVRKAPNGRPPVLTLQEAAARSKKNRAIWVELDEPTLQWDCDSMVQRRSRNKTRMAVLVTNHTKTVIVDVVLSEQLTCAELLASPPTLRGDIYRMDDGDYNRANEAGRFSKYPQATEWLTLYTFLNFHKDAGEFIILGLIIMIVGVVIGLWMLYERLVLKIVEHTNW